MISLTRREWITGPALAALGPAQAKASQPSAGKRKIVVCGGHPGDPEYGCGGTIARYTERGHEVVLLYLNDGEWPPEKPKDQRGARMAEASRASAILGARCRSAGQENGRAIVDAAHSESFRTILEAEAPDVLFTHWPIDNHADHRAITMLAYDVWLKLGKKPVLYYYEVSSGEDTVQFAPSHLVDISAVEPRKKEACYAHASQTPARYYALQSLVTRMRGVESGCRHAEGFIRHVHSKDLGLPVD